ncbi:phage tail sheath family protein [Paenibacillus larvae]|uniref:phage tail sheath family protein n=1 Tax=Paenibacillus larvae TaxID=1464 RepID=UPI0022817D43|nr:phage tail sheath family protein [Paenibacillus larvae]MCY9512084.1 phage tail sheath family protein [Paenibacillus larvae]
MAGGTWENQNKVRPGVYINTASERKSMTAVGERGTVALPLTLGWGPSKEILTINVGDDLKNVLGYDITAQEMLLLREAFKRAKTVKLYRLANGVKAQGNIGDITLEAKYSGIRGNDIKVSIEANIDDPTKFKVRTFVANEEVHRQVASTAGDLVSNDWVHFEAKTPDAALTETAGVPLTGGTNGDATFQDYLDFMAAIDAHEFHTIAIPYEGQESSKLNPLVLAQIKEWREEEGRKVQAIVANFKADYEGMINVKNGIVLEDGTKLGAAQATVWTAAATASAGANESLTYQSYEGAVDAYPRFTNKQIEEALTAGEFVFTYNNDRVIVEQDINSFTSYTEKKRKHFTKNRVIRTLDGIANDSKRIYETQYIGKVDNNADGRNLFKQELIRLLELYQGMNALQNFDAQKDVTVEPGKDSDSVTVDVYIQPVDAIEKIYMQVEVK